MRVCIPYRTILLAALILAALTAAAVAEPYVSFNGQFRIDLPDTWHRLDYRTVDYYLYQGTTDPEALNYEAVFSPYEGKRFADSVYLILTIDSVGTLAESQIDSVLEELGESFGKELTRDTSARPLTGIESKAPVYNPDDSTVAVVSELTQPDGVNKTSLLIMKFYELGIANFYFYAPDSTFKQDREVFANVVRSFTTKNLEMTVPKEEVKVADVKMRNKGTFGTWLYVVIVLAAVIAVALIVWRVIRARSTSA
jgi:hypothetical protein